MNSWLSQSHPPPPLLPHPSHSGFLPLPFILPPFFFSHLSLQLVSSPCHSPIFIPTPLLLPHSYFFAHATLHPSFLSSFSSLVPLYPSLLTLSLPPSSLYLSFSSLVPLTLVNSPAVSTALSTWLILSRYLTHLQLTYLSAVSSVLASSIHHAASL